MPALSHSQPPKLARLLQGNHFTQVILKFYVFHNQINTEFFSRILEKKLLEYGAQFLFCYVHVVRVFYCVTNCHKFSSIKQILLPYSFWIKVLVWVSSGASVKVLFGWALILLETYCPLPNSLLFLQCGSCDYRTEAPRFL